MTIVEIITSVSAIIVAITGVCMVVIKTRLEKNKQRELFKQKIEESNIKNKIIKDESSSIIGKIDDITRHIILKIEQQEDITSSFKNDIIKEIKDCFENSKSYSTDDIKTIKIYTDNIKKDTEYIRDNINKRKI